MTKVDSIAEEFAAAVRQAFIQVYRKPRDPAVLDRSIIPTWSDKGVKLGWHNPDPAVALVLTEFAWVQDPWSSNEDQELWNAAADILTEEGWGDVSWDSINPAIHIMFWRIPDEWQKILTNRIISRNPSRS